MGAVGRMLAEKRKSRQIYLLRRVTLLVLVGVVCLVLLRDPRVEDSAEESNERIDSDDVQMDGSKCNGEPFAYRHISHLNGRRIQQDGRAFDCSKLPFLKRFRLTREYAIQNVVASNGTQDVVFVGAADATYWPSMRAAYATVRQQFGTANKFVLYDLGKVNETFGEELSTLCNFEVRTFDFTLLPEDVRGMKIFAWKVFILAEMFSEGVDVVYLDSSIAFTSGDWGLFFRSMADRSRLAPLQLSGDTGHGLKFATNPKMYEFLPLDLRVQKKDHMWEANLILMHRSEATRQLLKWAVLCAATRDCIEPPGSSMGCHLHTRDQEAQCHRQDQSLLNILVYNLETELKSRGFRTIAHGAPTHPKNTRSRHETRRFQDTTEDITAFC